MTPFLTALGLFGAIALIAANGYFVAAEFSFVAARRSRFIERADQGDKKSARAVTVHRRLSFMLSGAQLGITVTTLVLGFIAEPAIAAVIEPLLDVLGVPSSATFGISLVIAFVLATGIQMVFGELAPKNLAIAKPEPVARALAPSTLIFMRVAGPVIRLFDGAANRLLRVLGIEPVDELHGAVSAEELDLIVDSSAESGTLTPSQAALLERAIDFPALEAADAMIPWNRAVTIGATATASDLRDAMSSTHSRFPVIDDEGGVLGIVHAKDLLGVERTAYDATLVEELAHPVHAVPEAAGLNTVLAELRSHSTEMALVIDEYGAPAGIITLEDIVEELVGEIEDEYDPAELHIDQIADGVWSIDAATRPDEVERFAGLSLPEGEYDTVAGLMLDRLERIAGVGDSIAVDGIELTVLDVDGYSISRIQLRSLVDPDDTDTEDAS
ncbi:MAG: hemolysin family protein [Actinomycetota bacterium]